MLIVDSPGGYILVLLFVRSSKLWGLLAEPGVSWPRGNFLSFITPWSYLIFNIVSSTGVISGGMVI